MKKISTAISATVFVVFCSFVFWKSNGGMEALILTVAPGLAYQLLLHFKQKLAVQLAIALSVSLGVFNPFIGLMAAGICFLVLSINSVIYLFGRILSIKSTRNVKRPENSVYGDREFSSLSKAKELDFDPKFSLMNSNIHH